MSNRSFKIITLGCKVNQYESAYLSERFLLAGWMEASMRGIADLNVINTCIVTHEASRQSRQAIRNAIRENPSGTVAAIGCYAQVYPEELSVIPGVSLIAGNKAKARLPEILQETTQTGHPQILWEGFAPEETFEFLPVSRFLHRTRAFLKVQDGCHAFCSYCIVPYARGPSRSLAPSRVVSTLRILSEGGCREVVLTGIHLGRYGADLNPALDLKGLLDRIGKERLSLRIRLSSLEPNEISPELVDMVASESWLCRHFHIPLQSGDQEILSRMNRPYGPREFARLIENIHRKMPLAAIGVDIMAGFPGENRQAFQNTLDLIADLPVSYVHVFPFSPRKRTPAAQFAPRVNTKTIKERAASLREIGQKKRQVFYQSCLGKEFPVLVEKCRSKEEKMVAGITDNYLPVIFPSSKVSQNSFILVFLKELRGNALLGRMISSPAKTP
jgi:threonylcarbamoyladenosine tRNA methylthiotransferase MtaB